ncbi:unnamed protein product, partial [Prunus brigantina]
VIPSPWRRAPQGSCGTIIVLAKEVELLMMAMRRREWTLNLLHLRGTAPEHNQAPISSHATESFRDKLMNKVNLVENVGIDVNRLGDAYDDAKDDDDVVVSKGEKGPSIQFSKRAMSRLCKPWQNALIIKLLGRSHTYNYLQSRLRRSGA